VKNKFLNDVECRWPTLVPAVPKILEEWKAVMKYFIKDIFKQVNISSNARYIRIRNMLNSNDTPVALRTEY